jgi:tRNA 2-thiouridine synthesizing protein A
MTIDEELDATGLLCPLPVLKAAKRLRGMNPGSVLKMTADDPAAVVDVPHFCTEQSYTLVSADEADGVQTYVIQKPV